jgi:hypothetical protein
MNHPIPLSELNPALTKYCDPAGPVPARMMAAKGLVPLKPDDLLTVLYQLGYDPDDSVRVAATEKATGLPENIVEGALRGAALDPRVLDYFANRLRAKPHLLEIIVLNHTTADETVARVAGWATEALSEVIATNEQRLLRHPAIIEALYNNRNARMSTVNRAIELAVRNNIVLNGIAAFKEVVEAIKEELIVDEPGPTPGDAIFSDALSTGDALEAALGHVAVDQELSSEAPASEQRITLQSKLNRMSTAEKIRAAQIGGPSERMILIRDNNHLVAMAAIKSPGIRDTEIIAHCRNRSLGEEVVRYIADRKEWTKNYQVKLNLVENPKTPLPKALNFLTHLRESDLRRLSRDKNVPAAITQAARNQLSRRQ